VIWQNRTSFGLVDVYAETLQVTVRQFRHVIAQWVALNGSPALPGPPWASASTIGTR